MQHAIGMRTLLILGVALVVASPAWAVDFRPFTKVKDVCPSCPKTAIDEITLSGGAVVKAKIVAQNDDFYVLALHGEVRAVPVQRIQSITWANGSEPGGLRNQDQIALKNGHVLSGKIVEESKEPAFVRLRSSLGSQTFVVFKDQIENVYKAGQVYNFTAD